MKTKTKRNGRTSGHRPVLPPLALPHVEPTFGLIPEPDLTFGGGGRHPDPKTGIPLYGPGSFGTSRHRDRIDLGFVGTAAAVETVKGYLQECCGGVGGGDTHAPFPGCRSDRGYRCEIGMSDEVTEEVTVSQHRELLSIRRSRDRFEHLLLLLDRKLEVLAEREHPLQCVFLVVDEDLFRRCRSVDYKDGNRSVHRDLRRAFKALAMKHGLPTQIIRERTTGRTDFKGQLDHPAKIAWNLFNGLYFKADGQPWGPTGLAPSSCHVGISFYRPLGDRKNVRASVVRAFDENGEGLVLRGQPFEWSDERRSPHLPADEAERLIGSVIERYGRDRKRATPARLVVHKSSRFDPEEREGFLSALSGKVGRADLVSLQSASQVRFTRRGAYPPLRGLRADLADQTFLYTTGYVPALDTYPHGHLPSPLRIADHVGDTPRSELLREVLVLTKMNWNSARMEGALPITLRFARLVGEILREVPRGQTPHWKPAFYM